MNSLVIRSLADGDIISVGSEQIAGELWPADGGQGGCATATAEEVSRYHGCRDIELNQYIFFLLKNNKRGPAKQGYSILVSAASPKPS